MKLPPEAAYVAYAPLTRADIYAIKALAEGKADAAQQVDALNWIIGTLLGTYDSPYRPDSFGGARASDYNAGKQAAGLQIRRVIAQPLKVLLPDEPIETSKS